MIAMLTVSGSQAICAELQTELDISGIKQYLLKHFNARFPWRYN
jgi:hypothetical protein